MRLLPVIILLAWAATLPQVCPAQEVWFDDLPQDAHVPELDRARLMKGIQDALAGHEPAFQQLAELCAGDQEPRIVFVSVSDGQQAAKVGAGHARGLADAIRSAVAELRPLMKEMPPRWIRLDIVKSVSQHDSSDRGFRLEIGLEGLALPRPKHRAYLPEQLLTNRLMDLSGAPQWESLFDGEEPGGFHSVNVSVFTCDSTFYDGQNVIALYRGHPIVENPSAEQVLHSAKRGGDYLARAVGPDGRFVYQYYPHLDVTSDKYNIVRHAGSVYAMWELYELTRDPALAESAKRALDFLLAQVQPVQVQGEQLASLVYGNRIDLGGNALVAIAISKYTQATQDRQHVPLMEKLGRWIQLKQSADGSYPEHVIEASSGRVMPDQIPYYAGESILAMCRIHSVSPRDSWLDSAERGAKYLIQVRDAGIPIDRLQHDHWLSYALNDLHRYRPNAMFVEHSARIARSIVKSQILKPMYPDWLGGYYYPPRTNPTATRSEALCAAYQLQRDFGDQSVLASYLHALQRGIAYQMQSQYDPPTVMHFPVPQKALGGFRESINNLELRNDTVQHNISSLVGYYRILKASDQPPASQPALPASMPTTR